MVRDSELCRVLDLVENLQIEFEHIINLLEILGNGFLNDHNSTKECEVSSICMLSRYIEDIRDKELLNLYNTLSDIKQK